jgi:cytochrome c-type biogenesis protein CcmH/NrfF
MSPDPDAPDPDQVLSELSNGLMSPYCPGRTIAACPSGQARKLEDHILEEAKAGKSSAEIRQELVQRFGPEIVGDAPQPAILWGALLVGALALGGITLGARRWVRRGQLAPGPGPGPGPELDVRRVRSPATADPGSGTAATAAAAGTPAPNTPAPSKQDRRALEDALDEEDGF